MKHLLSEGFLVNQGSAKTGVISREDAAMICVRALEYPPKKSVAFEVTFCLPRQSVLNYLKLSYVMPITHMYTVPYPLAYKYTYSHIDSIGIHPKKQRNR
jgi:hypothetical protein